MKIIISILIHLLIISIQAKTSDTTSNCLAPYTITKKGIKTNEGKIKGIASHKTSHLKKNSENYEPQLIELSSFMDESFQPAQDRTNLDIALIKYSSTYKYHDKRFAQGQLATIVQYTGEKIDLGNTSVYNGMILGFVLSRPTASLSNSFIEKMLQESSKGKTSEEMYEWLDSKHNPHNPFNTDRKFHFHHYDEFEEEGKGVGFLLLANTYKPLEGRGISQILLDKTLKHYESLGYRYVYAIGRYSKLADTYGGIIEGMEEVHKYLRKTRKDGLHPDHTVRFHQKAGGKIICALPCCARDPESAGSGFLVVYDLFNISA